MSNTNENQYPAGWVSYLEPFAKALGIDVAKATEILKPVAGEPSEQAIGILKDVSLSPDGDLRNVMPEGTPSGIANQAITLLREVKQAVEQSVVFNPAMDLLPEVPNDGSWLQALKAGGTLKIDDATVISAVRAALADRVGLYDLPKKVAEAMEIQADETLEQLDLRFFSLRKQLTQRSYAEIFAAIDGLDGNFVTERRKRGLLEKINSYLWPTIISFQSQLKGWVEAWQQGAANPGVMMSAMAQMMSGGGIAGALPPGMMQPPDSGGLRDAAEGVNDDLNRIFAGTGVVVARALAYDANQIKTTMEDSALPTLIGAASRDQMLRQLGVDVSSNYTRLEINLTKYVMGILNIKDIPAGNEETAYFGSLFMLGSQIPWDQIGGEPMSRARARARASTIIDPDR
jgi:hypothetical protein